MCSGRIDLEFIFRAFLKGADGVFMGGCRLNECNYVTHGNYDALNLSFLCKKILERMGVNPKRLQIKFMSAGDGNIFVEAMDDFRNRVRELGPLGNAEGIDRNGIKSGLEEVIRLVPYIKLKKREKLALRFDNLEEYNELYTSDEIDTLFNEAVSYYIDPDKCKACMICLRKCPVEAIEGGKNLIHVIDQGKCIKCGTCLEACPSRFDAVKEISGEPVPPPVAEEERTIARKKGNEKNLLKEVP